MAEKYPDWLTFEEVKARTGLPEQAIRRAIADGKLAAVTRGKKRHAELVCDPRLVDDWAAEAVGARAQVLPPEATGSTALARPADAGEWAAHVEAWLGKAAKAIAEMAEREEEGYAPVKLLPPSELRHKLFLTEAEARHYTGLGIGYLRKHVGGKPIGPRGTTVYRRAALEKL